MFQITPEGKIGWQYVSPYYGNTSKHSKTKTNNIYRANSVDYLWTPKEDKI
ncbi:MAG TPA: hypothetical protein ACHBX6_11940 [Arsenophonus nasoniae]|uniref:hypothetical protein n=1 Tax=Arsenophonus nasoniae TaxID=638 RepID=UPI0038799BE8